MSFPPPDPPPPDWDSVSGSSADFNQAQSDAIAYGWDGTNWAIKDSSGTAQYLYVGKSTTSGHVAWCLRTASNSGNCAQAKVPTATFDVIKGGTLNTQTMVITYNSHTYLLKLQVDGSGNQIAYAKQLT